MGIDSIITNINNGIYDNEIFKPLYAATFQAEEQHKRYTKLLEKHLSLFGEIPEYTPRLYSIPGRTELGGNHTDHNRGTVLAAAINLDTIAAAVPTDDMQVMIYSEGFDPVIIDISDDTAEPAPERFGTTGSLVTGIAAAFRENGYAVGGFKANTDTNVRKGSGLSSSAAIEITIASIFNDMYNGNRIDAVTLAKSSQYSENSFFGKPSGLMDQTACAYGGIVGIDFHDTEAPGITEVDYSFHNAGYTLAVVDTGGNHADLTPAYAAIPEEMTSVAHWFGAGHCRGITMQQLLDSLAAVRETCGDRAVLRAYHFLQENERAAAMAQALLDDDIETYLTLVQASGNSSFKYLQNVYPSYHPEEQGISLGIALSEQFLAGVGACRVHGGGFAGTIQTYIPNDRVEEYTAFMEGIFGPDSVEILAIRSRAAGRIL